MNRKLPITIVFLILIFCKTGFANENFKPWGTKLQVGDENINILPKFTFKNKIKPAKKKEKIRTVYNGVQGGAYYLIRFFQVAISPQDGPSCRFKPTCSAYGKHSVEIHGALLGAIMAGERLIRCNPYNSPGPDPAPKNVFGKN